MIEYPKDYFLDEVRDGFFVPGILKKAWAAVMKNYKALEDICKKKGLHCFGIWGSILGAVRHGGYIPWDDDIDVMMLRREYDVLKRAVDDGEVPENYWISDYEWSENENLVRKWLDSRTLALTWDRTLENYGFPMATIVDIFPIDYIPRDIEERDLYEQVINIFAALKTAAVQLDEQKNNPDLEIDEADKVDEVKFEKYLKKLEEILVRKFDRGGEKPLFVQLLEQMDEFTNEYNRDRCDDLAIVSYYISNKNRLFPAHLFEDSIDMKYETDTISIPIGYEGILRRLWSGYMYPILEFDSHGFPAYEEMMGDMRNAVGFEFLQFHFFPEQVENAKKEKADCVPLNVTIEDSLSLIIEADEYVEANIENEEKREELLQVLGQCQDLAVSIGEEIEARTADDRGCVSALEEYCNDVFSVYQMLEDGTRDLSHEDLMVACRSMRGVENRIQECLDEGVSEKKEIVFLCLRPDDWKSMHTIWEEATKDEEMSVIVIAVPYYLRQNDGGFKKDEIILDVEGYPDCVSLTSYDEYDFEKRHPYAIIYQCPYDEFSSCMSAHPYYYTSNLQKYTDHMIFIPSFVTREVTEGDFRSRKTLSFFVDNPGLIYSDHVFVQSEGMRDVYIELLDKFISEELAGDEIKEDRDEDEKEKEVPKQTLIDWSERISGVGSALYDWKARGRVLVQSENGGEYYDKDTGKPVEKTVFDEVVSVPDEWISSVRRPDGSFKKVILYMVIGSKLLENGEEEMQKARDTIKLFEKNSDDITILWRVDRYAREILRRRESAVWNEYRALQDDIKNHEGWIYDDDFDSEERAATFADAFYGDACVEMNMCRVQGKPVLWETPCEPLDEPDGYEYKEWEPEKLVVEESGGWRLENFISEVLRFRVGKPEDGNGKKIWQVIRSMD